MRLRIGVVGAGAMGMNHLRVLRDLGDERIELVGVADSDEATRQRAASRFQVAGYADYRQLIAEAHPDLVAVVVPTDHHFEVATHVLDAGVNVLVEKPICATVEQGHSLIDLAATRDLRLAVGHIERFNPAILALKRLLDSGKLGQIYYLNARRLGPFPPRIRDVGVILDLATHDLDAMRYLTGTEVERVYAETQRRVHQQHEDLLLGLVRFRGGAIGMLDVTWLTPTKVRELSVTGERGMYLVNYLTQDLYFYENDYTPTTWDALRTVSGVSEGTMTRLKVQKAEPLRLEYEDVIFALEHDTAPTVTGEDGVAVLRLAHQLIEATRTGEVIRCTAHVQA
jgi:predicted dehydrogenase